MKIGIIGVGNMGEALLSGIIKGGKIKAEEITIFDADSSKVQMIADNYDINIVTSNKALIKQSQSVILTVKPNIYPLVLSEISPHISHDHVLLSIAPGYNFSRVRKSLNNKDCKLVLMMSNTAAKIGQATTAACFSDCISADEKKEIIEIFSSFGTFLQAQEDQMPTLTSVIGSAPALVYMLIEGLIQGAIHQGLNFDQAQQLASNIVRSSASMIIETGEHPALQRDRICSPAGTTIEGVAYLEKEAFTGKVIEAVSKMAEKARKMQE